MGLIFLAIGVYLLCDALFGETEDERIKTEREIGMYKGQDY